MIRLSSSDVRASELRHLIFLSIQHFTCSALGHNETGKPFKGMNTEKPFLWIMNQIDSKLDTVDM